MINPEIHRTPADMSKFWCILVVSNTARFEKRYKNFWRCLEMVKLSGINYLVVELAFGHRQFMVTEAGNPNNLQLRTIEEFWHKENLINIGKQHLCRTYPGQVREIAWIDADCRPARPYRDWFEETWHELQHFQFVQMWETLVDLDDHGNSGEVVPSFMANYCKYGTPYPKGILPNGPYDPKAMKWGSPGLAWAANVEALDMIGGIPDYAVLGAGDWYLAHMLVSTLSLPELRKYTAGYRDKFLHQQDLCTRWIKHDVGYVRGLVLHVPHGRKIDRGYDTRERILIRNKFNPETDLKRDAQGLYQLEVWEPRQIKMRDEFRWYFRKRNEDQLVFFEGI